MKESTKTTIGAGRPAGIYARAPQPSDRERTPIEEQIAACRALAGELGYTVADESTVTDTGAGRSIRRPGLTALLGLLAERRVAAVIVYTLDRLARHESTTLDALLKELRRREIPLYVAKVPKGYRYDPTTGELLNDPEAVAAANREEWRPPEYIIIPSEYDPDR